MKMNGEVNGTMEEPMDTTSPPSSPMTNNLPASNSSVKTPSNHSEGTYSNSNHINDSDQTSSDKSNKDVENNENSNESHASESQPNETETNPLAFNENSNNISNKNYVSNNEDLQSESNESTEHVSMEQDINNDPANNRDAESEGNADNNQMVSEEEVDSEEDSSDDEASEQSDEPQAEDTVSVNSESGDDGSQDSQIEHKSNIVLLENDNGVDGHGEDILPHGLEIHEITSDNDDDNELNSDDKTNSSTNDSNSKPESLRRSTRTIKRKKYDDEESENDNEESDIEEVAMEDPLNSYNGKNKSIVINDTKSLVEMATKQMKANQANEKKEPTLVIIDTNSILSGKSPLHHQNKSFGLPGNSNQNAQELYQSIAARGTTVTPVSAKNLINSASQSPPLAPILPSLTDDMFVVEAPSFIVPYVYEKPSIKPFREFVDTLGKELDEEKLKEQEKIDKENSEKEKSKDKTELEKSEDETEEIDDKKEKEEKEVMPEKEEKDNKKDENKEIKDEEMAVDNEKEIKSDEIEEADTPKKKKKKDRKNIDDDDASWDGESSVDSDDEVISDDEEKTVVIKEKDDSIDDIKDAITDLGVSKIPGLKTDNYFDCSLGKFFINIGLSLVQEFVQNDLLKQQNRKLYREKRTGVSTLATETAISALMKNLHFSKENNAPYSHPQNKCEFCSFKSESMLSLSHHCETPHMKNNVYKCNFCEFEIRSPHDILYHMEAEHNIRGRLERAPAYHQCVNCPFEDNGKGKLARHLIPCAKKFKPEFNLAPPMEWEPPAKIPKITRARNNMLGSYQSAFNRLPMGVNNVGRPPLNTANSMHTSLSNYRPRGRSPMTLPPRAAPVHGAPLMRGGMMVRHNSPSSALMPNNYPVMNNQNNNSNKNASGSPKMLHHQPSISITPLPRQPQPTAAQIQTTQQTKGTFVICEICDGYIKDLEQLRNHMQWIHKVKIHPKMIYNRPPLNCQKCQFRFFTDQGLERHLLGSHGLVTSSMQEAANKGKDAGRCPVCGRVYQWKLLNHVARDHNLTLKPAHLSYKCTVCTATFGMYKQFENHVYSAHSVVAKRVIDKIKPTIPIVPPNTAAKATSTNDAILKPLKINDEITIIPQPVKPSTPTPQKGK